VPGEVRGPRPTNRSGPVGSAVGGEVRLGRRRRGVARAWVSGCASGATGLGRGGGGRDRPGVPAWHREGVRRPLRSGTSTGRFTILLFPEIVCLLVCLFVVFLPLVAAPFRCHAERLATVAYFTSVPGDRGEIKIKDKDKDKNIPAGRQLAAPWVRQLPRTPAQKRDLAVGGAWGLGSCPPKRGRFGSWQRYIRQLAGAGRKFLSPLPAHSTGERSGRFLYGMQPSLTFAIQKSSK
jgi:hypothetical protein